MKALYTLSEGDEAIFAQTDANPNIFTNWYIRGKATGTWWKPGESRDHLKQGYEKLHQRWNSLNRPEHFGVIDGDWLILKPQDYERAVDKSERVYRTVAGSTPDTPSFHHRHGFIFFPWQLQVVQAVQPTRIVIGGYGGGKSVGSLVEMLINAATLPGFVGLCLAPYALQSQDLYKKALNLIKGTIYEEKFLLHAVRRPYGNIVIGNNLVGENHLHFISILDDPEKVKTLEADAALIDQTEQFDDLSATTEGALPMITSRLRGFDMRTGRERLAESTWVANATDNPELWELASRAQEDPANYLFVQPSTYENLMLTSKQINNFERQFGRTAEEAAVHLRGEQPMGSGDHFSRETLEKCHSEELDWMMEMGLQSGDARYLRVEARGAGVHRWEIPAASDGMYMVAADPGWDNPPKRNSAAICVMRVDGFPKKPASLAAFHWVFGNNRPDPWMEAFLYYVEKYNAMGRCIYDATGAQRGYARLTDKLADTMAWQLDMGAANKGTYLTMLKLFMSRGMIQLPRIPAITQQLSKYEDPEPKKLRQDLVMMLVTAAAWLERPYKEGIQQEIEEHTDPYYDPMISRLVRPQTSVSRFYRRSTRR
jgi:hypothetical protein